MTTFNQLITDIKTQILEEDLTPIRECPEYEDAVKLFSDTEFSVDDIYRTNKGINPYIYWKPPVFAAIMALDNMFLPHILGMLRQHYNHKDDYKYLLMFADTGTVLTLNTIYWSIPEDERYDIFLEAFIHIDRGHTLIDKNIIKDVMSRRKLETSSLPNVITVYRGEGENSTPYQQAYSWTAKLETACFFAIRLSTEGKIYTAQVNKENIIAFTNQRNENEIIVFPEYLKNVQEMALYSPLSRLKELAKEGYIEEYMLYKNTFIKKNRFSNPEGIHGVKHAQRVLLLTLSLSQSLNLTDMERGILAQAACYHDIGRVHDDEDIVHGKMSWNKYQKKYERNNPLLCIDVVPIMKEKGSVEAGEYNLNSIPNEYRHIVRFIIENHCIDDKEAKMILDNDKNIQNKEAAWKLFSIFKDADALDRVRLDAQFRGLDINYLRYEESKKHLLFAKVLFDKQGIFGL